MKSSTPTIVAVMFSVFVCSQIGLAQAPTPAGTQAGSDAPTTFSTPTRVGRSWLSS